MRLRLLWCGEFSQLKTGYSIYSKEILNRLASTQKYSIAEHACYAHQSDPRTKQCPWIVYCNLPDNDNEQQKREYLSNQYNQFGRWRFEEVSLDYMQHVTIDIRDNWMCEHEFSSPYRPYYNHLIMPTVDAYPQNEEWIDNYISADGVFTYQEWSKNVLDHESGGKIKTLGEAPPASDDAFQPMDTKQIKHVAGLEKYKIVGTVMRNQRRKLFPDLFAAFKMFLEHTKRTDVLLYCHTSYPDLGWDIPRLLLQFGLSSKVLFTYVCRECGYVHPNYFSDALKHCPKCGKLSSSISNVQTGVDNKVLAAIYNMFDLYVQWSNSEGFGIPIIEAAACGIPIITVDYSAMSDVCRKVGGIPITPIALSMELETGCYRAVPNNDKLIEKLTTFFEKLNDEQRSDLGHKTRQLYLQHYGWNKTAEKWMRYLDSVDVNKYEAAWQSPPKYVNIPNDYPKNLSNKNFARWLVINVLGDETKINSYMETRLIRDLNYQVTNFTHGGTYFNETSMLFQRGNWREFNQEQAFKYFIDLGNKKNYWENKRWEKIKSKK